MRDSSSKPGSGGRASTIEPIDVATQLRHAFGDDVALCTVERAAEARGVLTPFDFDRLPFPVRRAFTVTDVPAGTRRGGHGHRRGVQALFCLAGRIDVELRRGVMESEVTLVPDGVGLRIAAGVWSSQCYALDGSALLVLASEPYDPDNYDDEYDDDGDDD